MIADLPPTAYRLQDVEDPALLVGELLGLEPKTVSKRFHRALDRVRAGLPDSVFDELDR